MNRISGQRRPVSRFTAVSFYIADKEDKWFSGRMGVLVQFLEWPLEKKFIHGVDVLPVACLSCASGTLD